VTTGQTNPRGKKKKGLACLIDNRVEKKKGHLPAACILSAREKGKKKKGKKLGEGLSGQRLQEKSQ